MHRLSDFACGTRVRFVVDGRSVEGCAAESVAGAILAAGRTALSRSLRFHRPRAMFCSTGECGWCHMSVNGRPDVATCQVPCRDGLQVQTQNAWPHPQWDLFALLDLVSAHLPATFYHHRLLWPRFLRQFFLRLLRRFTGQGHLKPGDASARPAVRRRGRVETDIAVVGAGLTGLSAALAAAETGARVILLDDRDVPGGARRGYSDAAVQALSARLTQHASLEYWPQAQVLGWYGPHQLGVVRSDSLGSLRAHQIILAPGALDALPLFDNNDLPGVMSARLVERLIQAEGLAPGRRAVVWGAPARLGPVAERLRAAGIAVARVLGPDEALVAVRGAGRVQAAVVRAAAGRRFTVACDLVVAAIQQPRHELLAQAGGRLEWQASLGLVAVRSQELETTVPGLFIVGEAARPMDAQRCQAEGRLAGLVAAHRLGSAPNPEMEELAEAVAAWPGAADWTVAFPAATAGAHVCFCEDVRVRELGHPADGDGYALLELVKRRTAVLTGPCQGKFCLANTMRVRGQTSGVPTARPPAKPVRLGDLVAQSDD